MTKIHTGQRLKAIMRNRDLKQIDILNLTRVYSELHGVKVTKQDLSQYIQEKVEPNQRKLGILAKALGVSEAWLMGFDVPMLKQDVTSSDEQKDELVNIYHQLTASRQQVVYDTAVAQLDEQKHESKSNDLSLSEIATEFEIAGDGVFDFALYRDRVMGIPKLISETRTSAGSGVMLYDDSDLFEVIFPEEEVYDDALEVTGVVVTGDSMQPKYHDGDVLWIDSRLQVDVGQIGIFMVDGESFVKKMGDNKLISLNSKYDDIEITEYTDFSQIGKVVDFTPRSVYEQIKKINWQ